MNIFVNYEYESLFISASTDLFLPSYGFLETIVYHGERAIRFTDKITNKYQPLFPTKQYFSVCVDYNNSRDKQTSLSVHLQVSFDDTE